MADDCTSRERDRALGMGAKITRRDFLNGVALTAGAGVVSGMIPPEMWAAAAPDLEPQNAAGYYPPAQNRTARKPSRIFRNHAPRPRRCVLGGRSQARRYRRSLRSCHRWRRHQRARRRAFFPQSRRRKCSHPDSRKPRRLRRARETQRIPYGQPHDPRIWRHVFDRESRALQRGRKGSDRRARYRCAVLSQVRQ